MFDALTIVYGLLVLLILLNIVLVFLVSVLYKMHNKKDAGGSLVWYVPRDCGKAQLETNQLQERMILTLRDVSGSLCKIGELMTEMEGKIEQRILERTSIGPPAEGR